MQHVVTCVPPPADRFASSAGTLTSLTDAALSFMHGKVLRNGLPALQAVLQRCPVVCIAPATAYPFAMRVFDASSILHTTFQVETLGSHSFKNQDAQMRADDYAVDLVANWIADTIRPHRSKLMGPPILVMGNGVKPSPSSSLGRTMHKLQCRFLNVFCDDYGASSVCPFCSAPVQSPSRGNKGRRNISTRTVMCPNHDCHTFDETRGECIYLNRDRDVAPFGIFVHFLAKFGAIQLPEHYRAPLHDTATPAASTSSVAPVATGGPQPAADGRTAAAGRRRRPRRRNRRGRDTKS